MKGLIFTYLLTYGGSVVALFEPFVGICIYYAFAVLRPQVLWYYSLPPDMPFSKYVALATMAGWVFKGFPHGGSLKDDSSPMVAFGVFVLLVQLSAWFAIEPARADLISSDMLKILVMFFIGICLLDSMKRLSVVLWGYIAVQGYLTLDMNLTYFLEGINPVVHNDGFGTLNNNTFALSLLPGLSLALMAGIFETRLLFRGAALFSALSSIHVILLSESRGAYLGLAAIAGLAFYFIPKNARTISALVVIVVLSGFLVGESVREEFGTMFADELDDSAAARFSLWQAGWGAMKDYPFLGAGPGNFEIISHHYGVEEGRAAHNLYMQIGADCGIPALVSLMSFYVLTFIKLQRIIPWKTRRDAVPVDPTVMAIGVGAFAGLAGYLLHSVFSSGVLIETPYLTALMALATVRVFSKTRTVEEKEKLLSGAYANVSG